ncbi:GH3 auxin-responsive promoter family protein, partial [Kingella sp. Marseille-Q4569]
ETKINSNLNGDPYLTIDEVDGDYLIECVVLDEQNYPFYLLAEHIAPQTLYHPRLAEQQSPEDWQIRTAALLAQSPSLSLISAWSPTLLLNIIHTLHQQQDRILSQIPDAARRHTVAQALAPAIPNTQKIWTQLDTISCWDSHTAAAPAAQLRQLFPHAHLQGKGLLATEGITTLPFSGCLLPALTSHYYEFADEHGQIRPLHQLQHGNRYRLILTTQGGLYRYDTQDWLLVQASPHANVPSLHFIGRSSLTSDLVGEKLTEAFVAHAIPQALAPFSGCLFLQGSTTPQPHYILWHEPTFTPSENALAALNTALCANPQYHYAQQIGQLGNLTARPHPQLLAYASQHAPSRVLGTQKIPMLLPPIT